MNAKAVSIEQKRQQLPVAALVKHAERKTPARPSETRLRRVDERLLRSPFISDED